MAITPAKHGTLWIKELSSYQENINLGRIVISGKKITQGMETAHRLLYKTEHARLSRF